MCPSYMATRDEAHSTRGRANVLRLAMTGQLGDARLSDPRPCTRCSICASSAAPARANARSSVDVARFKSEFLAGYWDRHGTPLTAHAFGYVRTARAGWGSRFAPLVERDRRARSRAGRAWQKLTVGIDRRRTLPLWTRRTLRKRAGIAASGPGSDGTRGALRRHVHRARRSGDRRGGVRRAECRRHRRRALAPHVCCGRPLISQGLLAGGAPARRGQRRTRSTTRPRSGARDRVRRAELPVGGARGRAGAAARRAAARARAWSRATRCCSRSSSSASCAAGRATLAAASRARARSCSIRTAISARWAWRRRRGAAVADSRRRRSPISTPAAAAWPGRSATRAITTTCRRPSASGSCCRPRGPWRPDAVLVAAGTSCRHQVPHFAGVDAVHPGRRCMSRRSTGEGRTMNLAWISLAALVVAITLSMVTRSTSAWCRWPWRGSSASTSAACRSATVIGTFPIELFLTLAGVTLLFGMANANGTLRPHRGAGGARLPRQRRRHPGDVLRRSRVVLSSIGPGNIATTAILAPMAHGGGDAAGDAAVPDGADGRQRRAGRRAVAVRADRRHRQRHHGADRPGGPRDWRPTATTCWPTSVVTFVAYFLFGGWKLFTRRRVAPSRWRSRSGRRRGDETVDVEPFDARALAHARRSWSRWSSCVIRSGLQVGHGGADRRGAPVAGRGRRREGSDQEDAVGRGADGVRRHGADRRASEKTQGMALFTDLLARDRRRRARSRSWSRS